jgi:signal transduction histidine kinase
LKSALAEKDMSAVTLHAAITSVDFLVRRASDGLEDLRDCVYGLRKQTQSRNPLLDSLRRYADKFTAVTGIHVSITTELDKTAMTDRLAAEIFQIATETLNGVQRHTTATSVELKIERTPDGRVVVRTTDNSSPNARVTESPETTALGEQRKSFAEYLPNGMSVHTIVNVKIPL